MDITKLLDANIVEKFLYIPSLIGAEIIHDHEITIVNSGIPSDMFNIICEPRDKKSLKFAIQKFHDLKMPFACWIGFDSEYHLCKQDLEEMGFVCSEHESAMFVEITKLSLKKNKTELQILLIDDNQKLNDYITIYQQLIPHDSNQIEVFYSMAEKHILKQSSSLKLFIGYINDRPIATSALFVNENVAGVWDVTTLKEFRRNGIGTDMTLHALFYAIGKLQCEHWCPYCQCTWRECLSKNRFSKIQRFLHFQYKCTMTCSRSINDNP